MGTAGAHPGRPKGSSRTGALLDKTSKGLNRKGVKAKSGKKNPKQNTTTLGEKRRMDGRGETIEKEKIDGKFRLKSNAFHHVHIS